MFSRQKIYASERFTTLSDLFCGYIAWTSPTWFSYFLSMRASKIVDILFMV